MSKIDEVLKKIEAGRYQLEEYEPVVVSALVAARRMEKRSEWAAEWIDISVERPPLNCKVLLCTSNGEVIIGSLLACWGSHDNWHYKWSCYTKTPIAWLPLPAPFAPSKKMKKNEKKY